MSKVFEDYFSELQADMVSVCLEYVGHLADNIYIYCSYEPRMYAFDVCYRVNGMVVRKHKLNKAVDKESEHIYDVSEDRQDVVLDVGLESLEKLHEKCKRFSQEMPTEMKLYYDVKKNSLKGTYHYDLIYSNEEELLPMDIFTSWFEEVEKSNL